MVSSRPLQHGVAQPALEQACDRNADGENDDTVKNTGKGKLKTADLNADDRLSHPGEQIFNPRAPLQQNGRNGRQ